MKECWINVYGHKHGPKIFNGSPSWHREASVSLAAIAVMNGATLLYRILAVRLK